MDLIDRRAAIDEVKQLLKRLPTVDGPKQKKRIMPLVCLRCGKNIPLSYDAMDEVSYTHYSYCEGCLREGLKLLREKDKEDKK